MPRGVKQPPEERFWNFVKKTDTCWVWQGALDACNYGLLGVYRKVVRAHRFSWTIHYGDIPIGLQVLHKCDNPPCVLPDHLFLGTVQDNSDDKMRKGRDVKAVGSAHRSAKLTETQVLEIRRLYRVGGITQKALGSLFGVTADHIGEIVRKIWWKHLVDPSDEP